MRTRSHGRSLELYFIEGKPDGMLTAEVFNWTGHVLVTPRTRITEALRRSEASFTGVYLLLGERDGLPLAYIGEGEVIADRIRNHDSKRDWWTKAVMVTTGANNLNKAHVKYLESRLIEEALSIGRVPLENGVTPSRPGLSESAVANMEGFLENLAIVLPAIGVDLFVHRTRSAESRPEAKAVSSTTAEHVFETSVKRQNIHATAKLENGEFVVQAGSNARKEWVGPAYHNYKSLFEELMRSGVLQNAGDHSIFAKSYAFSSPSAAGSIVTGRSCNGQLAWVLQGTSKTYQEWEQERLSSEAEGEIPEGSD
jgi:hypothetical protein